MQKITRRIRRYFIKRKLYKRYGNHVLVDFRSDRVFRLPDNPRRGKNTADDLERVLCRTEGTAGSTDGKHSKKAGRIHPRGIR